MLALALVHFRVWHHCGSLSRDHPVSFWPAQGPRVCSMAPPALAGYVCCTVVCCSSSLLCPSCPLQSYHLHCGLLICGHAVGCAPGGLQALSRLYINPVTASHFVIRGHLIRGQWLPLLCWRCMVLMMTSWQSLCSVLSSSTFPPALSLQGHCGCSLFLGAFPISASIEAFAFA